MKLAVANTEAIKYACRTWHYSKSVPQNVFGYSVLEGETFCGVIVYAYGTNRHIGIPYGLKQGQAIELVRVALNGRQSSTSKAIAISLRLLRKFLPAARLVVSYADLDQGHIGTVYQASNWTYVGLVQENLRMGFKINGKKVHSRNVGRWGFKQSLASVKENLDANASEIYTRGKHKYLYPLTVDMVKLCKEIGKPFPKKEGKSG